MSLATRIVAAVTLFAVAAVCGVGYLAAYELTSNEESLQWQAVYGAAGVGAAAGAARLAWRPAGPPRRPEWVPFVVGAALVAGVVAAAFVVPCLLGAFPVAWH